MRGKEHGPVARLNQHQACCFDCPLLMSALQKKAELLRISSILSTPSSSFVTLCVAIDIYNRGLSHAKEPLPLPRAVVAWPWSLSLSALSARGLSWNSTSACCTTLNKSRITLHWHAAFRATRARQRQFHLLMCRIIYKCTSLSKQESSLVRVCWTIHVKLG